MKTGNTAGRVAPAHLTPQPQWSPVMKTGNTRRGWPAGGGRVPASMEPGHEDREYLVSAMTLAAQGEASMEPGHEDREYAEPPASPSVRPARLNGARS